MDESKVALFLADHDHQVDQVKKIYALLQKKAKAFIVREPCSSDLVTRGSSHTKSDRLYGNGYSEIDEESQRHEDGRAI